MIVRTGVLMLWLWCSMTLTLTLTYKVALAWTPVRTHCHSHTLLPHSRSPIRGSYMHRYLTCSATPGEEENGKKLYDAAYAGNIEKLKAALAECKGNKAALNWRNVERYGRTPLVIAAYYNKIESVKLLLSTSGVDINASSDFGATALHFAAHRGHLEVVQLLLSKGAKVNALATGGKWTGKTPLDVVTGMGMSGRPEVSEALIAKGGKPGK